MRSMRFMRGGFITLAVSYIYIYICMCICHVACEHVCKKAAAQINVFVCAYFTCSALHVDSVIKHMCSQREWQYQNFQSLSISPENTGVLGDVWDINLGGTQPSWHLMSPVARTKPVVLAQWLCPYLLPHTSRVRLPSGTTSWSRHGS
jgi:hypothetical protein